jgi:peroxiredoxin
MSKLITGNPIPLFELPDLQGQIVSLAGLRGKIVLLNFWSCECPWAKRADEMLAAWLARWGERVAWISLASNANESAAAIASATAERQLPQVLQDAGQIVADAYGAVTTPHIFVIDAEGLLRYQGGIDDTTFRKRTATRRYAFEAVEALLTGEQPPVAEADPYGCTIVRNSA